MENLIEIWKQICESNLFNFVVMVLLLAWLVKKFDLGTKIEAGRKKIESNIAESETAKEENLKKLYEVQEASTKIDEEMLKVFNSAEEKARFVGEKLLEEGKIQAESIKETAQEAMKLAEQHIKSTLESDPNLHQKFIWESIDAIDGIGVI